MKQYILAAILFIASFSLFAKEEEGQWVPVCKGLSLRIPDYYTQVEQDKTAYAGMGAKSTIMIKTGKGRGLPDAKKYFDLSDCFHTGSKSSSLWNTKDQYRYDYWTSDDNDKFVSYSGMTASNWYCILMSYQDDADVAYLKEIVSNKDYHENWWGRFRYYFHCSARPFFILSFFIMPFLIFVTREHFRKKYFTYFVSLSAGLYLFGAHLGDFLVSLPLIGIVFLWGLLIHEVQIKTFVESVLGGED